MSPPGNTGPAKKGRPVSEGRRLQRRAGAVSLAATAAALLAWAVLWPAGDLAAAKPFDPNAAKKAKPPQSAPKPKGGPGLPAISRRVVLVSLDGAAAETLQQLWRDDQLDEGGFARFFREGQVAAALVPVDPTVTGPNHVSLVTGAAPDHTGIVGNRFHPAAAAAFETASAGSFPVAAETLWETVGRRQRVAAVLAWPGADGSGSRWRAAVGTASPTLPEHDPKLLVLQRSDWHAAASFPKLASQLPVLTAHVTLEGAAGAEPAAFDLFAVGHSANGREEYDGVVVAVSPAAGATAGHGKTGTGTGANGAPGDTAAAVANLRQSEPLGAGQWAEVSLAGRGGRSICWVKVLALDPGLENVRVYFSGTYAMNAHPPDFAKDLEESDIAWPGAPDDRLLAAGWKGQPGIDLATWTEQADRLATFFGSAMRVAAERDRWELILGYIPVIDLAGHTLLLADSRQAGYSAARRDELARARLRVWQAVDRELRLLLAALDLGRTTVVVVSDHGMAPAHTAIDLNALLHERGAEGAYAIGNAGMAHLYLARPASGDDEAARQKRLRELRDQLLAWRLGDELPIERALTRQEAAELGLDHPNSGDLVLFARPGYVFDAGPRPAGQAVTHPAAVYGAHGYLASHPEMQGIYLAIGKDIKPASTSPPVQAIDVAGRIAAWLGIEKPRPTAPGR
jgi:predicted AlkP superfamily pyrophosphatase or phosphodiesterase